MLTVIHLKLMLIYLPTYSECLTKMKGGGSIKSVAKAVKSFKSKSNITKKRLKTGDIVVPNRKNKKGNKYKQTKTKTTGALTNNTTSHTTSDDFEHQLSELVARENSRYLSSLPKPKFCPVLLPSVFETVKSDLAQQAHMNSLDQIDRLLMEGKEEDNNNNNNNKQCSSPNYYPDSNAYNNDRAVVRRRPPPPPTTLSRRNMFSNLALDEDTDNDDDNNNNDNGGGKEPPTKNLFALKPSILSSTSAALSIIDDSDI
jgi:hypothetical protein